MNIKFRYINNFILVLLISFMFSCIGEDGAPGPEGPIGDSGAVGGISSGPAGPEGNEGSQGLGVGYGNIDLTLNTVVIAGGDTFFMASAFNRMEFDFSNGLIEESELTTYENGNFDVNIRRTKGTDDSKYLTIGFHLGNFEDGISVFSLDYFDIRTELVTEEGAKFDLELTESIDRNVTVEIKSWELDIERGEFFAEGIEFTIPADQSNANSEINVKIKVIDVPVYQQD